MKLTITLLTKMLEKGQLECIESEYDGLHLYGKYKITNKGFETLDRKMLKLIQNEKSNNLEEY